MILIGLTGGLASGKSTVARMLEAKGAEVINADSIAREVVAPARPAFQKIIDRFGPEMIRADGTLDREALGNLVFQDAEARGDLEAITLPEIYTEIARLIQECRSKDGSTGFVVIDAALLVETGGFGGVAAAQGYDSGAPEAANPPKSTSRGGLLGLDALVVVRSERDLQIQRAVKHRAMDAAQAGARIAAQAPISLKLAAADYVIDNRGSLEELTESVDTLWSELTKRFK